MTYNEQVRETVIDLVHYETRNIVFNNKVWKQVYMHFMDKIDIACLTVEDFLDYIAYLIEREATIYPLYVPDSITGLDLYLPIYSIADDEGDGLYGIVIEFDPNKVYKALIEFINDRMADIA